MIVAVTGSTGLVGSALVPALAADGHAVRRVVRHAARGEGEVFWDPAAGQIDAAGLAGVEAVVHLAGENVAGRRWNEAFKRLLVESRTRGTRLLCEALTRLDPRPRVLCSASASGYYGDCGDQPVDESSPGGDGFAAHLCQEWEAATAAARDAGIRVVNLRIGVVLDAHGGALAKMLTPFRLGVGGVVGSGRQYVSWIALDDLVRAIGFVLAHESLVGPVNAVAPEPVTNRELTKTLGRVLRRPTVLPLPAFVARLALGEMADEMLLGGVRAEPTALAEAGFSFAHPRLEPALRHVLGT